MYILFHGWCIKEATKFWTLGDDKTMNLSITWCNLSPLRTSIGPYPSSFNKCSKRKVLFTTNAMVDMVAFGVRDASSSTKDLICSNIYLEQPFATKWSCVLKWIVAQVKLSWLCMMYYMQFEHNFTHKGMVLHIMQKTGLGAKWSPWSSWTLPFKIVLVLHFS